MRPLAMIVIVLVFLASGTVARASVEHDAAYLKGLTALMKEDMPVALKEFRHAAEGGVALAFGALGLLYAYYLPEAQRDLAEAVQWFRRGVEAGDHRSIFELARLHLDGRGVPKDDSEAARLFERAATEGDPHSQVYLARFYALGIGVQRNEVTALTWLDIAIAGFRPGAERDSFIAARKELVANMAPAELEDAARGFAKWLDTHPNWAVH